MATVAEINSLIIAIQQRITNNQQQLIYLDQRIAQLTRAVDKAVSVLAADPNDTIAYLAYEKLQAELTNALAQRSALVAQITSDQTQLNQLNAQLQNAAQEQFDNRRPTASSGNLAQDDQQARVAAANSQNPSAPPQILESNNQSLNLDTNGRIVSVPDTASGTNAEPAVIIPSQDTGTDAPVRTTEQTQAITNKIKNGDALIALNAAETNTQQVAAPTDATVSEAPGAAAPRDDSGDVKNATKAEVDSIFNSNAVTPLPNVLDQYGSYSYSASLYLMSPAAFQAMVDTKTKKLNGAQLLFQSGGAAVGGRSPYFSNDYYIENITINSTITGRGTGMSHNANNIKITVIEPNGITLINNLDRAVSEYIGLEKKTNLFASQLYLLVIKFYGYDQNGNLVRGGAAGTDGQQVFRSGAADSSDSYAFVEKWYPLCINNITFKVSNKLVEYEISATAPQYQMPTGQLRGTIPYNVELSAATVKDALTGPTTITTTGGIFANPTYTNSSSNSGLSSTTAGTVPVAPQNANAALNRNLTIRQGLMTALNNYQADLVKRGIYTYPDEYSVEFANPSIAQATVKVPGDDKKAKPMAQPGTAANQLDGAKQSMDNSSRTLSATAGTQVVQFMDQILRNSGYVRAQATVLIDETTGKQESNGRPADNVAWYKINLQAVPYAWDDKRNDYAYRMKYVVSAYKINQLYSDYFSVPRYQGVHKQYNYWFTGENTSVLDYEQTYNALYSSVLSGGKSNPQTITNDAVKKSFQVRSSQSSQGAAGRTNEIGASAAGYLYEPGDNAHATLTIVGDPAWLQQGEAWAGVTASNFNFSAFLPDGTINVDSQQVLFEILINTPGDYNLNTGLIDPNDQSVTFQSGRQPGAAKQSYVYIANTCVSQFVRGKFTQVIEGTLLAYYPDQTVKQQQQTAAATARQTLNNNAVGRTASAITNNSLTPVLGSLSTPAYVTTLNNSILKSIGAGIAINQSQQVLGGGTTMPAAPAEPPTSSGQDVGVNGDTTTVPPPNLSQPPAVLDSGTVQSGNFKIVTTTDPVTGSVYQQVLTPQGQSIASGSPEVVQGKLQYYINRESIADPTRVTEFQNAQAAAAAAAANTVPTSAFIPYENTQTQETTLSTPQTMAGSDDAGTASDVAPDQVSSTETYDY